MKEEARGRCGGAVGTYPWSMIRFAMACPMTPVPTHPTLGLYGGGGGGDSWAVVDVDTDLAVAVVVVAVAAAAAAVVVAAVPPRSERAARVNRAIGDLNGFGLFTEQNVIFGTSHSV